MKNILTSIIAIIALSFLVSCQQADKKKVADNIKNLKLELANVDIYLTAKGTDKLLTKLEPARFEEYPQPEEHAATIMLDASRTFQTILGIGGAITDASAETYYKLPKDKQQEIMDTYFSADKGIGYSLIRTNINSCDFSSGSYVYTDSTDKKLERFTVEHDKQFKIPMIKEAMAKAGDNLKLFISPWSPPAWMKSNREMLHGGKLLPDYYQTWADYYVKFIQAYKKEGIPIWGTSVQNEPMAVQTWESCIYTAEEERDFVKKFLGPTLATSDVKDTKIVIWDHNRGIMYQRAQTVYEDKEASKYVWGTGFHWYTGDHFDNVKMLNEAYPDKGLLFTEGCVFPYTSDSLNVWHWGETYGRSLIHDLNNGVVGWLDWNILLDETGGPNHVGNNCLAPIIGDTKTGKLTYMNSFYYLGHFSKFIRPGAKRIACTSNDDDLIATAFINTDNSIATVIQNETNREKEVKIWINGKAVTAKSAAHSIITAVIK